MLQMRATADSPLGDRRKARAGVLLVLLGNSERDRPYLDVRYQGGRPVTAYLRLGGDRGSAARRTVARPTVLIDYGRDGSPIGLVLTAPSEIDVNLVNEVLSSMGAARIDDDELAPLRAEIAICAVFDVVSKSVLRFAGADIPVHVLSRADERVAPFGELVIVGFAADAPPVDNHGHLVFRFVADVCSDPAAKLRDAVLGTRHAAVLRANDRLYLVEPSADGFDAKALPSGTVVVSLGGSDLAPAEHLLREFSRHGGDFAELAVLTPRESAPGDGPDAATVVKLSRWREPRIR